MRNTVETFRDEEFTDSNIVKQIKSRRNRRSILTYVVLALVAAIALWMYVISENNTCSGVKVDISGNERLMSNNYSVSIVEPASVDLILRGKNDLIKQIVNEKHLEHSSDGSAISLIAPSATVNIFKNAANNDPDTYIFEDESQVKAGEFTVKLQITLPDGVTCQTKYAKVRITETASRQIDFSEIQVNRTSGSFGNGFGFAGQNVSATGNYGKLTVSGNEELIGSIGHIALNIDWLKEITGDVSADLVPTAYDVNGGEIDSRYLHFEPETLHLDIHVNKSRSITLKLETPADESVGYSLSQTSVKLVGPVKLIDALTDTYVVNGENPSAAIGSSYVLTPDMLVKALYKGSVVTSENEVYFEVPDGANEEESRKLTVSVVRTYNTKNITVEIPASNVRFILPEGYTCKAVNDKISIDLTYTGCKEGADPDSLEFLCVADLSGLPEGVHSVSVNIGLTDSKDFTGVKILKRPIVEAELIKVEEE